MSGSGFTAALAWRPSVALAVAVGLCCAGALASSADPPAAVGPPDSRVHFEDFLRFESQATQTPLVRPEPGPGCSVRPSSSERSLPDLARWWSEIVSRREAELPTLASDETIVLHGTGYNYRRGPAAKAFPRPY